MIKNILRDKLFVFFLNLGFSENYALESVIFL